MTSADKKALQLQAVKVREGVLTSTHGGISVGLPQQKLPDSGKTHRRQ